MRNGMPQRQPQQQQLNESIERTKALMNQMKSMPNQEAIIFNLLQQNPQLGFLSNMLRNGNSLEGIAKQIAQYNGYDINTILSQLNT